MAPWSIAAGVGLDPSVAAAPSAGVSKEPEGCDSIENCVCRWSMWSAERPDALRAAAGSSPSALLVR